MDPDARFPDLHDELARATRPLDPTSPRARPALEPPEGPALQWWTSGALGVRPPGYPSFTRPRRRRAPPRRPGG